MKKILLATLAFAAIACGTKKPVEKVLIAGSYWDSIAIVDKASGTVEWSMPLPGEGPECNSVEMTKNGDILFSYKKGARLVNRQGKTIWDFQETVDTAEMQTATQLPDGSFMLASCDNPSRIIELDSMGQPIKEVKFNLGIANPHGQFRKVAKSKNGNYLIPVMSYGAVLEIGPTGDSVNMYKTGGNPFSLIEKENGDLIVSCGDAHALVEVNRATGEAKKLVGQNDIAGATLQFVAGAALLPNGNIMVSNWLGHVEGECKDLQLVEFDPQNNLVWSFNDIEKVRVKNISALYPFSE